MDNNFLKVDSAELFAAQDNIAQDNITKVQEDATNDGTKQGAKHKGKLMYYFWNVILFNLLFFHRESKI